MIEATARSTIEGCPFGKTDAGYNDWVSLYSISNALKGRATHHLRNNRALLSLRFGQVPPKHLQGHPRINDDPCKHNAISRNHRFG
jgi:hypothetical protein